MSMPIWAAFPPEVHSAALSSGPGPGSLLAAAQAWQALKAEYDSAAAELSSLLAAVQAGTWQGPSAEAFVAAHVPYLAWLLQNSANSSTAAAEQETVAAAYTAALSAMPTLTELEANHALHAQLVATNFFGVNTVPIALNEIDYLRMWLQAATVMAMYEAVSETALTWTPPATPPPPIQKTNVANHDEGGGPTQLSWWVTRVEEVDRAISGDLAQSSSDPSGALTQLASDPLLVTEVPHWAGESLLTFIPQAPQLTQLSYGLIAPFIPLAGGGGLAGLAGLSQPVPAAAPALPGATTPVPSGTGTPAAMAPAALAPAATPATSPAPAPASTTAPAPGAAAPPTPPAATHSFGYPYVVGPPGVGTGGEMSTRSRAEQRSPQPDSVPAAAAAATGERARRRRSPRPAQIDPGYRYEYLDEYLDAGDPAASTHGAGTIGSSGAARPARAGTAAGLTTLAGEHSRAGPTVPMLPSDRTPETGERAGDQ
ncbi:PPE family protein [Mycobacterium sp. SMC-2]|uniref:PPE family protein n=1 Tax=Mycobacterium sp. SMC-2 TaxID=2857058 RepID=UPI0021B40D2E|nr:PPE family protein [Mycobacterium sp. SMC-2]UXA09053.1 PPE family protein [Mycobacterium sp. SMC-2]